MRSASAETSSSSGETTITGTPVSVFDDPFTFDITRDPNNHIAFGAGGPHFCLGAQLARLEIKLLFEELAGRYPKIEALGPPDRLRSNFIGGIKHLPVRMSA